MRHRSESRRPNRCALQRAVGSAYFAVIGPARQQCQVLLVRPLVILAICVGLWAPALAQSSPPSSAPVSAKSGSDGAQVMQGLGTYERSALATALLRRKLVIEPEPSGRRLRTIHVVNLDVFSKDEGFLRWFNVFHVTTREKVISREVLLRPGDAWDEEIVDETRRRLRDPLFTTLVVLVPVQAPAPHRDSGMVDLLVVTRDIWSLRMNSKFEVQEGILTELRPVVVGEQPPGPAQAGRVRVRHGSGRVCPGPAVRRQEHRGHAAAAIDQARGNLRA